jgi:hypothetical protein
MNLPQIQHQLSFHGIRHSMDYSNEIRIELPDGLDATPPEDAAELRSAMQSEWCADTSLNELEQIVGVMLNADHSDEARAEAEKHFCSILGRSQAEFNATLNSARALLERMMNQAAKPDQAQTPTERFHTALNQLKGEKPWTANHHRAAVYLAIARLSEQRDFDAVAAGMETI